MTVVTCLECGSDAELVGGEAIYPHRRDLYEKKFYRCACGASCGCHPGTTAALGHPCGPATRAARSAAHAAFDRLWKNGDWPRSSAYVWLSKALGLRPAECHIGLMSEAQAWAVVAAVKDLGDRHP